MEALNFKHVLLMVALFMFTITGAMAQSRTYEVSDTWDTFGHKYEEKVLCVGILEKSALLPARIAFSLRKAADATEALRELTFDKEHAYYSFSGGSDAWFLSLIIPGKEMNRVCITCDYISHWFTFYQAGEDRDVTCGLTRKEVEELKELVLSAVKKLKIKRME